MLDKVTTEYNGRKSLICSEKQNRVLTTIEVDKVTTKMTYITKIK